MEWDGLSDRRAHGAGEAMKAKPMDYCMILLSLQAVGLCSHPPEHERPRPLVEVLYRHESV